MTTSSTRAETSGQVQSLKGMYRAHTNQNNAFSFEMNRCLRAQRDTQNCCFALLLVAVICYELTGMNRDPKAHLLVDYAGRHDDM